MGWDNNVFQHKGREMSIRKQIDIRKEIGVSMYRYMRAFVEWPY